MIENVGDSAHLERCLQEMLVLIALRHPNILSVFGHSRPTDGTIWLVMEFVEGGALSDRVKRAGGPLPMNEALHYLLGLARALAHAHSKFLSHNDVKADNILLQIGRDADGGEVVMVKLADFGLVAKLKTGGSATFNHIKPAAGEGELGTINFLAPENLNPEHPDYAQACCHTYSSLPVLSAVMLHRHNTLSRHSSYASEIIVQRPLHCTLCALRHQGTFLGWQWWR